MKKTILIAALIAAFSATAQRQSDNNDRARENRKEYDSKDARVESRNGNRNDENRNQNDYAHNGDRDDRNRREADNRRDYGRHDNRNKNRGNVRVEVYGRGYGNNNYGNRNYGYNNNGYRYGRDDRYNHAWDNAYAPANWNRDTQLRISDGQRRGLITDFEARRLFRELDRVLQREQNYSRNGYFSQRERENLIDDIRDLNQEISRQMHDDDYYRRNGWFFRNGY